MAGFDEFIDRLKDGTNAVADTFSKATKNAVSKVELKTRETKIRYAMHEVEDRINKNFAAIGASVYKSYKAEEDYDDFSELFGRLDALDDELEALKDELYTECGLSVCPECGGVVSKGNCFCPKCGVKIKDEQI